MRIPVEINNVGTTSDAFERSPTLVRSLVHFNPVSNPNQLAPHRSTENGDTNASTDQMSSFVYANSLLYGLTFQAGAGQKLFQTNDFTTAGGAWSNSTNMSVTASYQGRPIDYHGALYLSRLASTDAYTYAASRLDTNLSGLSVPFVSGVVHSKDDRLYLASTSTVYYGNSALAANPPTLATTGIVVPANLTITSICEYGDYLAIGCAPTDGFSKSVVFLWGRDITQTTLSASLDWGVGNLQVLEQLDGVLIGISYSASSLNFDSRIIFRSYSGGVPQMFRQLVSSTAFSVGDLSQMKQKVGNQLYFLLTITLNGTKQQGLWRVGRPEATKPFTVSLDYLPNGDTGLTSGALNGFIITGDYVFLSYTSSSVYGMSKTDDQANYTATSYFETCINPRCPEQDFSKRKILDKFGVQFAPLTSGQQIVAKYRVDNGAWITIFTKTFTTPIADVAQYTQGQDATNTNFTAGVYYEFRIESTGGAVPVGYTWEYTVPTTQQQ